MTSNLRIPPSSHEAEQAVLSSILQFPPCYAEVEFLAPEDFYYARNREVWEVIRLGDETRDLVSVMTAMADQDARIYVGELARGYSSPANVKVYAGVVRDRAILRRLVSECAMIAAGITPEQNPADAISAALRRLEAIADGSVVGSGPRHIFDLAPKWHEEFTERRKSHGLVGYTTPFHALNSRWGGLRGGQVIVIAGRPKTGKTTLAVNIAEHIAKTDPVAVFQMEMSEAELIDRAISSHGRVSITKIRNGDVRDNDAETTEGLLQAMQALKASKLYIDATPRQTMNYIRMHAKAFVKKRGKGAIVIDYLGLIRSDSTSKTKNDEISEISRDVKLLAKETDCPVILLCQMNRAVEKEKRKPQLSDLRDSGAIEQDADIICFTHKDDQEQNYSEIITRAMRSGVPGTDILLCEFGISRFENPPEGWEPPQKERQQTQSRAKR